MEKNTFTCDANYYATTLYYSCDLSETLLLYENIGENKYMYINKLNEIYLDTYSYLDTQFKLLKKDILALLSSNLYAHFLLVNLVTNQVHKLD